MSDIKFTAETKTNFTVADTGALLQEIDGFLLSLPADTHFMELTVKRGVTRNGDMNFLCEITTYNGDVSFLANEVANKMFR